MQNQRFYKIFFSGNNNLIQNVGKYFGKNGIKTTKVYCKDDVNKPIYKNYISISLSKKETQQVSMKLSQYIDNVDYCWIDSSESWMIVANRWILPSSFNNGGLSGNWEYMQIDNTNKEVSVTKGSATDPIYAMVSLYYTIKS